MRSAETAQARRIAEAENAVAGYQTGPEQLEHDAVYFVRVSIREGWFDKTNFVSVVQRITIEDPSSYRHSRSNRLVELPWLLEGGYYRFFKNGTNLSYMEIPPPQRLPQP